MCSFLFLDSKSEASGQLFPSGSIDELENQIFGDLQDLKVEQVKMENQYGRDISNLLEFQSKMKQDVHRLWDNVHDMQEVGNITSKNIEEIYVSD